MSRRASLRYILARVSPPVPLSESDTSRVFRPVWRNKWVLGFATGVKFSNLVERTGLRGFHILGEYRSRWPTC